jgi:hypothetical protein
MIEAGERFMATVDEADEALDTLVRALGSLARSRAEIDAAAAHLAELDAEGQGREPDAVIDLREFARGIRDIHALFHSNAPDVDARVEAVLERMRQVVVDLHAADVPEVAIEHTDALFSGLREWVHAADAASRHVRSVRQAIDRARRGRARLSLLFSGRSRSSEIFGAADDALAYLEALAAVMSDAVDNDAEPEADGTYGEGHARLVDALNRFGEAVSASVRRTFRI